MSNSTINSEIFRNFASKLFTPSPMEKQVIINGKRFGVSIPEATIAKAVHDVAQHVKQDYYDKNPMFVVVLNGAFLFASDIIREMDFPCQIEFCKLSSYIGTSTSGEIIEEYPVSNKVRGRHVVIIEDIVETGYTMKYLADRLAESGAASVEICALSTKPARCKVPGLRVKYVGMTLPDDFIVGYGLDYDQQGRNLRDIYSLIPD